MSVELESQSDAPGTRDGSPLLEVPVLLHPVTLAARAIAA